MRIRLLPVFIEPRCVLSPEECFFYHTMELPGLGVIRGQWDLRGRFDEYVGHAPVSGRRVLDVGCATGFLSFSAEQAGASEVVSFDMDDTRRQHWLPFKAKLPFTDPEAFARQHNAWLRRWHNGYWLCHRLLESRSKVWHGDVYALPREMGLFDVTIVGSILEHLSDPIRALSSIARVTSGTMSRVVDVLGRHVPPRSPDARLRGRSHHDRPLLVRDRTDLRRKEHHCREQRRKVILQVLGVLGVLGVLKDRKDLKDLRDRKGLKDLQDPKDPYRTCNLKPFA